jgi:hypothetical protein
MEQSPLKQSLGRRLSEARPTKTVVFWACTATMIATMVVGFTWGGWVTGGTAVKMAEASGEEAVAKRLAPMCVVRFKEDPNRDAKLKELKEASSYEKGDYVKKQGWATMPGETEASSRVADECSKLLMALIPA